MKMTHFTPLIQQKSHFFLFYLFTCYILDLYIMTQFSGELFCFEFVFLHLFFFVQRLLQALSHGFVLLHAGGDCPQALCQLLGPGLSQPQAALQILPVEFGTQEA